MSDLNRFVTEYCTLWRTIGLKLGLKNSLLKLIAGEHPMQFRECFRRTLQYWLDQDMNATWSTLELAISNARRDELSLDNLMEMPTTKQLNGQEEDKEHKSCHYGTSSLADQNNNVINMMIIGISGHGKSTLSNFILQQNVFQSGLGFLPVSMKAEKKAKIIQGIKFNVMDTVGFSDSPGLEDHHLIQISDALDAFSGGINAIVFVIKSTERFTINISTVLTNLEEMSDIWDHCFVVFTNVKGIASTEPEQLGVIQHMLAHPSCPESLASLLRMVNNRYMVVESVMPMGDNYYMNKINEMIRMIKNLKTEPYTNKMFQAAFSKYKEAKEKAQLSEKRLLEQQQLLEFQQKHLEEEKEKQERERQEREEKERQEKQRQKEEQERIDRHKKKQKHNRRQRRQFGRF